MSRTIAKCGLILILVAAVQNPIFGAYYQNKTERLTLSFYIIPHTEPSGKITHVSVMRLIRKVLFVGIGLLVGCLSTLAIFVFKLNVGERYIRNWKSHRNNSAPYVRVIRLTGKSPWQQSVSIESV